MDFETDRQLTLKCLTQLSGVIHQEIDGLELELLKKLTEFKEDNHSYLTFKFRNNEAPIFTVFCEHLNHMLKEVKRKTKKKKKQLFKNGLKNLYEPYRSKENTPQRSYNTTSIQKKTKKSSINLQEKTIRFVNTGTENYTGIQSSRRHPTMSDIPARGNYFEEDVSYRIERVPSTVKIGNNRSNESNSERSDSKNDDDFNYSPITNSQIFSSRRLDSPTSDDIEELQNDDEEETDNSQPSIFQKEIVNEYERKNQNEKTKPLFEKENEEMSSRVIRETVIPEVKKIRKESNGLPENESQQTGSEDYNIFKDDNLTFTDNENLRTEIINKFQKKLEMGPGDENVQQQDYFTTSKLKKGANGVRYHELSPGLRIIAKEKGLNFTRESFGVTKEYPSPDKFQEQFTTKIRTLPSSSVKKGFVIQYDLPHQRILKITDLAIIEIKKKNGIEETEFHQLYHHLEVGLSSGKFSDYLRKTGQKHTGEKLLDQNFFFFINKKTLCFIDPNLKEISPLYFKDDKTDIADAVEDPKNKRLVVLNKECNIYYRNTDSPYFVQDKSLQNLGPVNGKAVSLTPESKYLILGYESNCGNGQQEDNLVIRKLGKNNLYEPYAATFLSGSKGKFFLYLFFFRNGDR